VPNRITSPAGQGHRFVHDRGILFAASMNRIT